jgi:limonene-1,2-epoxide hydrolase
VSRERCVGFMADLERRDLAVLARWFTDQTELWVPPAAPVRGRRRILAMFRAIYRMYADIHWRVTDVFAVEGGRWVYLTESWGTIGRDTPYRNHLTTLVEFDEEGRIVALSDYFKDTAIFGAAREPVATNIRADDPSAPA